MFDFFSLNFYNYKYKQILYENDMQIIVDKEMPFTIEEWQHDSALEDLSCKDGQISKRYQPLYFIHYDPLFFMSHILCSV